MPLARAEKYYINFSKRDSVTTYYCRQGGAKWPRYCAAKSNSPTLLEPESPTIDESSICRSQNSNKINARRILISTLQHEAGCDSPG